MTINEVEARIKEIEGIIVEQQGFARQINNAILMLEGAKQENMVRLKKLQEEAEKERSANEQPEICTEECAAVAD